MKKREYLGIGLFFVFGGLFMMGVGYFYFTDSQYLNLKQNGIVAEGRVVKYTLVGKNDNGFQFLFWPLAFITYQTFGIRDYWITLEFTDQKGGKHQFRNGFAISAPKKIMGKKFSLYYNSIKPSQAIVYDFFYFFGIPIILFCTGLIMAIIGYFSIKL